MKFCFPSYPQMIAYLKKHNETNKQQNPDFKDKKIIRAVAEVFANQKEVTEGDIRLKVILLLNELDLPVKICFNIDSKLIIALKDCGTYR